MTGRRPAPHAVVVVLTPASPPDGPPLGALLARARRALVEHQRDLFAAADARLVEVPAPDPREAAAESFGGRLAALVDELGVGPHDGLVVLGAGAVPLLRAGDARRLVETATSGQRRAATNNRYSSDVVALGRAAVLRDLPPLPGDNALPRWLAEVRGYAVAELPGRDRLALDLDTPLDLALIATVTGAPRALRRVADAAGIAIPRREALRAVARDARRELLVAGRSGSRTLAWLERALPCRVRFLAEERGLRASSPVAPGAPSSAPQRPPRSTLGRLLAHEGPEALGRIVAELADGAVVDTRVLLADRLGADEAVWPTSEDRFASDLLLADRVGDPWLRALTVAAATASVPVVLGSHTIAGPGVRPLLGGTLRGSARTAGRPVDLR